MLLLTALPMALLLSSCFVMQGFWINANSIVAGGKATKATFQIHALRGSGDTDYQFFLIGVSDSDDLKAGKATWGTNGVYGGPYPLPSSANLASIIGSDCQSNGFDLGAVTGITWRGYTTPTPINDKNKVNKDVMVQVGLEGRRQRRRRRAAGDRRDRCLVGRRRRRAGSGRQLHLHRRQPGLRQRDDLTSHRVT